MMHVAILSAIATTGENLTKLSPPLGYSSPSTLINCDWEKKSFPNTYSLEMAIARLLLAFSTSVALPFFTASPTSISLFSAILKHSFASSVMLEN